MALSGTVWKLNQVPSWSTLGNFKSNTNFFKCDADDYEYRGIILASNKPCYRQYMNGMILNLQVWAQDGMYYNWANEKLRYLRFIADPEDLDAGFETWLQENAVRIPDCITNSHYLTQVSESIRNKIPSRNMLEEDMYVHGLTVGTTYTVSGYYQEGSESEHPVIPISVATYNLNDLVQTFGEISSEPIPAGSRVSYSFTITQGAQYAKVSVSEGTTVTDIQFEEGSSVTDYEPHGLVFPDGFVSNISSLPSTNDATATASDIKTGKTAYANGSKITGTFNGVDTSDANATLDDIRSGKTAYVNGSKVSGIARMYSDIYKTTTSKTIELTLTNPIYNIHSRQAQAAGSASVVFSAGMLKKDSDQNPFCYLTNLACDHSYSTSYFTLSVGSSMWSGNTLVVTFTVTNKSTTTRTFAENASESNPWKITLNASCDYPA